MKISTKNTEVLCLSTNPRQCMLQVSGSTLHQVEKFMYLGVLLTSDGRWGDEIDTRFGKANAVLRELYRSVVTKWELSNTAKLSVFKLVFVPILTYGHESWVMTERILFQVQAEVMGFLRRVHGATQGRTKVRWCPEQETSLVPPCSNLRPFGKKCTVLKTKLATLLGLFGVPSNSAPWALWLPFTLRYTAGVTLCDKLRSVKFAEP